LRFCRDALLSAAGTKQIPASLTNALADEVIEWRLGHLPEVEQLVFAWAH
jgi:hypothetical protein